MASPDVNYRSLVEENPFQNVNNDTSPPTTADIEIGNEIDDTPRSSGVMIHMVPETNKTRWNHIDDLDSFFTRMYAYHQKRGFTVIVLEELFQLGQFAFVVWLLTFTIHCIDYPVLFGEVPRIAKVTISDVVIPMNKCVKNFGGMTFLILFVAIFCFIVRFVKMIYHLTHYSDIKKFYNTALHIEDSELDNITWHEIKKKIREVQAEQHMCIDKDQLTELDIYHRILRFKNYMVALMNKNLLPVKYRLPIIGEVVSLSRGLLFNIDFILFRGPGSPFQNNWQLRADYTVRSNQNDLAQHLSKLIFWVAIANLILSPVIFLWQLIYFSFAYANVLRKEPGALGMRTWSNYGRLYLRHYNELEHELDARLNRAYEYADRYVSSFSSPVMAVVAKNLLFISGGLLVLVLALGIYEEYVFQVEHVLTIITVLSAIGLVCRTLIPDENMIWCPEQLMTAMIAHVHYLPITWKSQAHTKAVKQEFENFFQFKAGYFLNEIFSPFVTPFVLIFVFRPRALEIVKFFRSFTVTVRGVGNVCSFAQMDVRKHGNPNWQVPNSFIERSADENIDEELRKRRSIDNGKTELSLVRFTLTNPEWQMPKDAVNFLQGIRKNALDDLVKIKKGTNMDITNNPIQESLQSFGTLGEEYSSIATSVFGGLGGVGAGGIDGVDVNNQQKPSNDFNSMPMTSMTQGSDFHHMLQKNLGDPSRDATMRSIIGPSTDGMRKMRVFKTEGRLQGPADALLYSLQGVDPKIANNITDVTVAEMCLSTLYLHELHKQNVKNKQSVIDDGLPTSSTRRGAQMMVVTSKNENTPLLSSTRS